MTGQSPDDSAVSARAPGRVNLIGDHTDYAGGLAMPMAIDLATTVTGRRTGRRIELASGACSGRADIDLDAPSEPSAVEPDWARYAAAVARLATPDRGFLGRVDSTLPLGAGLSSSASLELALALALGFEGSPLELALLGQRAEQLAVGVPCGLLDQLAIAFASSDHAMVIDFSDNSVMQVRVPEGIDIIVVHSGQERTVEGSAYADRRRDCERAAQLIGPLPSSDSAAIGSLADPELRRRARHVSTECERVRIGAELFRAGDVASFGELMSESHRSLRDDFDVSTPALDLLVDALQATAGVLGARLTGAGFGGCVVALCKSGAVADPTAFTGRGWKVVPAEGARLISVDTQPGELHSPA
jgi:galactokinase